MRRSHLVVSQAAELPGGADHHLQVVLAGRDLAAVEDPLADAVDQHDVRQVGDGPVEP